ncbi:hypothetical protein BKA70DRAFT_1229214 [Coprinopsis sp. MPI-PUGE-AT-0042]|nr:hypothetical protein BKA70DRAFT_1229214 [Coprinopsis sp. MPI-PUGE-AT-0042]
MTTPTAPPPAAQPANVCYQTNPPQVYIPVETTQGPPSSPRVYTTRVNDYNAIGQDPPPPPTHGIDLSDPTSDAARAAVHAAFSIHCDPQLHNWQSPGVSQPSGGQGSNNNEDQKPSKSDPSMDSSPKLPSTPQCGINATRIPTMATHGNGIMHRAKDKLLIGVLSGKVFAQPSIEAIVNEVMDRSDVIQELHRYCYTDIPPLDLDDSDRFWQPYFDLITQQQIREQLIAPIVDFLWRNVICRILSEVITYIATHVLTDRLVFPDLAQLADPDHNAAPHRLKENILWYALTGAYLHFFFERLFGRETNFSLSTEHKLHCSAEDTDPIVEAISRKTRQDLSSDCDGAMLHYRHGGLMLVLRRVIDEVVKLTFEAGDTTLSIIKNHIRSLNSDEALVGFPEALVAPSILGTLKLPIAIISTVLFTCYHANRIRITPDNVLKNKDSMEVLFKKYNSAGDFLAQSYHYIHRKEVKWLSLRMLKHFSPYHSQLSCQAVNDFALTPVPQNTHLLTAVVNRDRVGQAEHRAIERRNPEPLPVVGDLIIAVVVSRVVLISPSAAQTPPVRERNALLDGKLVRVVLLSDLTDDINPLSQEDVDWDAWGRISPGDTGEDLEDQLTDLVSQISLSSSACSSPWDNLPVDPLVAAEERALRLGPYPAVKQRGSRRAAYVVYFGRRMGVFITWEATTMQVCGFKCNSYQGYDTIEEARSHWMHALATRTWGDPRRDDNRSIPPFEGYHIIHHASVDSTAIPLSEAMKSKEPTAPTDTSSRSTMSTITSLSSTSSSSVPARFSNAPSSLASKTSTFHRGPPSCPTSPDKPKLSQIGDTFPLVPSLNVMSLPPKASQPLVPHRKRREYLQRHVPTSTPLPAHQPSGQPEILNHARQLTTKDKYYVVQIGLEPGVCKGEAEARRCLGPSRFAFAHIEATRKAADAHFRSLVDKREVFEAI